MKQDEDKTDRQLMSHGSVKYAMEVDMGNGKEGIHKVQNKMFVEGG